MTKTRNPNTEGSTQQEPPQDNGNLDQHSEQAEDDFFNRKERLQQLEDGMIPQTNTILSVVFQEIKKQSDETRKKSMTKNKIHFFKAKPRLLVSISRISKAGKVKNLKDRIWLMHLSSFKRSTKSATQRPIWICPKDSIASLHASSTRFPVW